MVADRERRYFNQAVETMPREALEKLQLRRLRQVVERAAATSPFYRELYRQAGVSAEDIRSLEDVRLLPFVDKEAVQDTYPFGLLMCHRSLLREVHAATSPRVHILPVYATAHDLEQWGERCARILWMTGLRPGDSIQNAFRFGLSTGGFGFHYGAMTMGMLSIPASTGGTDRQIDRLCQLPVTAVTMMPSYAHFLGMRARERGIDLSRDSSLSIGLFGAEPFSAEMRSRIEELLGITAYDEYGMNEFLGPGMACECVLRQGLHVWADQFLLECVDPDTGEPVREGSPGELVWSWLSAEATAVIRFRSHDLSRVNWEPCACGRTHPRITRIGGRSDSAHSIGGYVIYPSRFRDVLAAFPEAGPFLVVLDSRRGLDTLLLKVEVGEGADGPGLRNRLAAAVRSYMGVTPVVELARPGSLGLEGAKQPYRVMDYRKGSGRYGV